MKVKELLDQLLARDVVVRLAEGKLVVKAPKGALSPELVDQLRDRKQELIGFLGAASLVEQEAAPRIQHRPPGARVPLSPMQEALWATIGMGVPSIAFNMPTGWWLDGPLDIPAMQAAIAAVIRRHETLRTAFVVDEEGPHQVAMPDVPVDVPIHDLTDLPEEQREERCRGMILADARREMDLNRPPLVRFAIFELGPQHHCLYLTAHHLVWEGWSFDLILAQLARSYEDRVAGGSGELPPLDVQYGDYVLWQRERMSSPAFRAKVDRLLEGMDGCPTRVELPVDHRVDPSKAHGNGCREGMISRATADRVLALARREGLTPFMVYLAVLEVVLSRWSGQRELVLGMPHADTGQSQLEEMIGFFVNLLVLRGDVDPEAPFRTLLQDVKGVCLRAFADGEVPFGVLAKEVAATGDGRAIPNPRIMFTYQDARRRHHRFADVELKQFHVIPEYAQADVQFALKEFDAGISIALYFSEANFEAATFESFLDSYLQVLEDAIEGPEKSVQDLRLASPKAAQKNERLGLRIDSETWSFEALQSGPGGLARILNEKGLVSPEVDTLSGSAGLPACWCAIVDESDLEVPDGMPGELRLEPSGQRLGLCARVHPKGDIQILGRMGARSVMVRHGLTMQALHQVVAKVPGVADVACLVRGSRAADNRLLICVAPGTVDPGAVRAALAESLPAGLVPDADEILLFDELPKGPDGRVDRGQLLQWAVANGSVGGSGEDGVLDDQQLRVGQIWARVLGVVSPRLDDDFFESGGHSMLALSMADAIAREFGTGFSPATVFLRRTLRGIAEEVSGSIRGPARAMVPLRVGGQAPHMYCVCGIALYQGLADCLEPHQPVSALYVPEEQQLSVEDGGIRVADLARAYLDLLLEKHDGGPLRLAGFCFGGALAFEVARLATKAGLVVDRLVLIDAVVWRKQHLKLIPRLKRRVKRGLCRWGGQLSADRTHSKKSRRVWNADGVLTKRLHRYLPSGELDVPTVCVISDGVRQDTAWTTSARYGWEGALTGPLAFLQAQTDHLGCMYLPWVRPWVQDLSRLLSDPTDEDG